MVIKCRFQICISFLLYIFNFHFVFAQPPKLGRFIPEYEESKAIVYSTADVLARNKYYPDSVNSVQPIIDERVKIYQSLVNFYSDLQHIFIIDKDSDSEALGVDNSALANEMILDQLRNSGKNISTIESKGAGSYNLEWTRDYVGLPYRYLNDIWFFTNADRGANFRDNLLQQASVLKYHKNSWFEGGNFMVDSKNRCFTASNPAYIDENSVRELRSYCNEVITLPELPLELTGHIDLFAKIINPKTVFIANYKNDDFEIKNGFSVIYYKCDDETIQMKKFDDCKFMSIHQTRSEPFQFVKTEMGNNLTVSITDLASYFASISDSTNTKFTFGNGHKGTTLLTNVKDVKWSQHTQEVKAVFEKYEFNVVLIDNPQPYLDIVKTHYVNSDNKVVYSEIYGKLVFRSYINSLVTNSKAAIPVYNIENSPNLNSKAIETYEAANLSTIGIPSDYVIRGGGAIHCITSQIPKL